MTARRVDTTRRNGMGFLTLNSPADRNALSGDLLTDLDNSLDALLADEHIRSIVLTGSGSVFCSGADLKTATDAGRRRALNTWMVAILRKIADAPKPVICAVNGHVRGGGIGLVAVADIAVAARSATFAFSEVRLGVVPAVISVPILQRIPSHAALPLFLTGRTFDADEAVAVGLVNAAVDGKDLEAEVQQLGGMIQRGAPSALANAKRLARRVAGIPADQAYDEMLELSSATFESAEAREGVSAFLERREPVWAELPHAVSPG
jgi:methylglutaconyl-CoA hydratase